MSVTDSVTYGAPYAGLELAAPGGSWWLFTSEIERVVWVVEHEQAHGWEEGCRKHGIAGLVFIFYRSPRHAAGS